LSDKLWQTNRAAVSLQEREEIPGVDEFQTERSTFSVVEVDERFQLGGVIDVPGCETDVERLDFGVVADLHRCYLPIPITAIWSPRSARATISAMRRVSTRMQTAEARCPSPAPPC
jgi:hypothetical protein